MATTTNFGWETPDDTDLVTDGAAAIRTSLNGVDSSFVDLKGGTTGQILSKASNTDLDYTWIDNQVGDITGVTAGTGISGGGTSGTVTVTNSMATAIDAKGDLIAGTGADAFARLGVGANGTVLTADSAEATGMKWAATGGGGGLVFIDRQSFSGVGSFSFTSKFNSTYDNYRIVMRVTSTTGTSAIWARMRSGSTDNTSSNYRSGRVYQLGSGVTGIGDTTGTVTYFAQILERNGQTGFMSMDLYSPYLTDYTGYTAQANYYYTSFGQHNQISTGQMDVTTSYDGITFYANGGTMTGEVALYGYARS